MIGYFFGKTRLIFSAPPVQKTFPRHCEEENRKT